MNILSALVFLATIPLLPILGIAWLVIRLMKKDTWKIKMSFVVTLICFLVSLAAVWAYSCDHQWVDTSCTEPRVCASCGITDGGIPGHQWEKATCTSAAYCTVCHEKDGSPTGHNWVDATCENAKTCTLCNKTEGGPLGHSWNKATCTVPETCDVCGTTQGEPLGHEALTVECDEDTACYRCGETIAASGHTWQDATCQKKQSCTVCGEETGEQLNCEYQNGICIYCGTGEQMVWIPRTGSKYHSDASCSNMVDPTEVPLATAENDGYTACEKCYG